MANRNRILILLLPLLAWAVGMAPAQGGLASGSGSRQVGVSIDMASSSFAVGDPVEFTVRTDQDAWAYVFSTDANGTTRQIFPNGYHRDNYLQGSRTVSLPESSYSLVASEPRGTATLSAFATTEKFEWLRAYDVASGEAFPVRQITPQAFHERLERSVEEAARAGGPGVSGLTGGPGSAFQPVGYRRGGPSFGYYSRSFTIIIGAPPPPPRPVVIREPYPVYEPWPVYEPVYVPPPVYVHPRPVYVYPRSYYYYHRSPGYYHHHRGYSPRHDHGPRRPDHRHDSRGRR